MIDLNLGWRDPVGIFVRLQTAVKTVAQGKNNFRVRMDRATSALVGLRPEDFPERIRGRATNVLKVRARVRRDYGTDALFHFELLTPKQRIALMDDILSLYEACLIDLGKAGHNHIYPKDR